MNQRKALAKFISENTSQAAFARKVGCSESHLSLILSGDSDASPELAKRISQASGLPAAGFVSEKARRAALALAG